MSARREIHDTNLNLWLGPYLDYRSAEDKFDKISCLKKPADLGMGCSSSKPAVKDDNPAINSIQQASNSQQNSIAQPGREVGQGNAKQNEESKNVLVKVQSHIQNGTRNGEEDLATATDGSTSPISGYVSKT